MGITIPRKVISQMNIDDRRIDKRLSFIVQMLALTAFLQTVVIIVLVKNL